MLELYKRLITSIPHEFKENCLQTQLWSDDASDFCYWKEKERERERERKTPRL